MITGNFPIGALSKYETPFYYYDMDILRETIAKAKAASRESVGPSAGPNIHIHYAVKACATPEVLHQMAIDGLGADCVSGGEVRAAIEAGIPADKVVFAGVAKTDKEIQYALEQNIYCFNVESEQELSVISDIAARMGVVARVCLRINPNVDAHTHAKITTGLNENKFGIQMPDMLRMIRYAVSLPSIEWLGLHFHIGSQITDMSVFAHLSERINTLQDEVWSAGFMPKVINVGGGLGILYEHPNHFPIPDFDAYFDTFRRALTLRDGQQLHCELGRSMVAQCGNLITRVLYVKQGVKKQFAIVDAGMTDLIRPALYGAFHRVENLSNAESKEEIYDIVGPICESSDVFVENYAISTVHRGDMLVLRSAGAYGEVMASQYNLRRLPGHVTSDQL